MGWEDETGTDSGDGVEQPTAAHLVRTCARALAAHRACALRVDGCPAAVCRRRGGRHQSTRSCSASLSSSRPSARARLARCAGRSCRLPPLPCARAVLTPLACAHACPRWQVKKARCRSTGEARAVKIIDKRLIGDVEDVLRYTRELAILNTLNHKHIIKLHEVSAPVPRPPLCACCRWFWSFPCERGSCAACVCRAVPYAHAHPHLSAVSRCTRTTSTFTL